jgi:hypothetical protein
VITGTRPLRPGIPRCQRWAGASNATSWPCIGGRPQVPPSADYSSVSAAWSGRFSARRAPNSARRREEERFVSGGAGLVGVEAGMNCGYRRQVAGDLMAEADGRLEVAEVVLPAAGARTSRPSRGSGPRFPAQPCGRPTSSAFLSRLRKPSRSRFSATWYGRPGSVVAATGAR